MVDILFYFKKWIMLENDIHKLLLAYGLLPMNKVLSGLEAKERYEECFEIKSAIDTFKSRFRLALYGDKDIETEEEYYEYYKQYSDKCGEIIKSNMEYYIKEIKEKLSL